MRTDLTTITKILIPVLIILLAVSCANAQENSFDTMCSIMKIAEKNENFMSLPIVEKSIYLETQIEEKVAHTTPAYQAYAVIVQVDPKLKYTFFKEAAEEKLGKKWECAAMDRLNSRLIEEKSTAK